MPQEGDVESAGNPADDDKFSENAPVPEEALPIQLAEKHRRRFQTLAFKGIASLVGLVTLATLTATAFAPDASALAGEIAKMALPALIALLGAAVTWAFSSDDHE